MKSNEPSDRPCPKCRSPRTARLQHASAADTTDHYRCDSCGHMWNDPKAPKASAF